MTETIGFNPETSADAAELRYKDYFESRKDTIKSLLDSYSETPAGIQVKSTVSTYSEFSLLEPITPNRVAENSEQFVRDSDAEKTLIYSGGTTGKQKTITRTDKGMSFELPEIIVQDLNHFEHPVLLHKKASGAIYEVADKHFTERYPKVDIEPYDSIEDFIQSVSESDYIYLMDVVSAFKELFYDIGKAYQENPNRFANLKGKYFTADLSASPVEIKDFEKWYGLLNKIFGESVFLDATYGLSETGEVGVYVYSPGDKEVRYKISETAFLEVLDPLTGEPIIGKEGLVVVTNLAEEYGTILPRYVTGDLGRLELDDEGNAYLVEPKRDPESGMIDVKGNKIFAPDIQKVFEDKLGYPIRIVVSHNVSSDSKVDSLTISVLGGKLDIENQRLVKDLSETFYNEYPFLKDFKDENNLTLEIELLREEESGKRPPKEWAISANPEKLRDPFDIEGTKKEFTEYFGIKSPEANLVIVPTREEFDKLRNKKTETWQVGTTIGNTAYVLAPEVWEEEGFHDSKEFPVTIRHELIHIFFKELSGGNNYPFWLNEGIAYYLCNQKNKIRDIEDPALPSEAFKKNNKSSPRIGYRMVESLIGEFGKEKIIELVKECKPGITPEEFEVSFENIFGCKPDDYYSKIMAQ